jgi:ABC-2 type transport system ATP-binding protein
MEPIIQVENLTKTFKVYRHFRGSFSVIRNLITSQSRLVKAVDQVTFQVNAGEVVGYLGPNGAGKSTTIKMLTGLLVPTSGNLQVNGFVPWRDRKQYVRRIGAVFGQRTTLWWDLPVIESFDLLKYIYDIPHPQYDESLREFKRFLALDEFLDIPVRSLSLGQRMRADLCAAMLHNPELIYLDEPTIGLDVVAKENIRKFIQHINRSREVTVILTTHDLSDIEKLCDRVMIIDKGRLLYDGTLVSLNEQFGGKRRLVVDFSESYDIIQVQGAEIINIENQRVTFQFERDTVTASELIGLIAARYRIRDLQVLEPEIEETIRRIYEDRLLENDTSG